MNHFERALQENWLGYVWECIGRDGCRRSGALRGKSIASIEEWNTWTALDLLSPETSLFVQKVREAKSERSLKAIARRILKKELYGYRDYATTGLRLLREASSHDDMVLGYSLIGLALDKFPKTTPCQFWFCFRDVPAPNDGKQKKYCDTHDHGGAGYMRARWITNCLAEAVGQNPNQPYWSLREMEEEHIVCGGHPYTPEEQREILEFLREEPTDVYPRLLRQTEEQYINSGGHPFSPEMEDFVLELLLKTCNVDKLPSRIHDARSRVQQEADHGLYESLGLVEAQPYSNWQAVVETWARKYPWLPHSVSMSQSWPEITSVLKCILNDRHCNSLSIDLWDAKLENYYFEQELSNSYDKRRRPQSELVTRRIKQLAKEGVSKGRIASSIGISRSALSHRLKRVENRDPEGKRELQDLW